MSLKHILFLTFISAFFISLILNYWIDKFGGAFSCLGSVAIFLLSAVAMFFFIQFASTDLLTIAAIVGIAIVVITLIVHLISQK